MPKKTTIAATRYREAQLALGKRPHTAYLTDREWEQVSQFITTIRSSTDDSQFIKRRELLEKITPLEIAVRDIERVLHAYKEHEQG